MSFARQGEARDMEFVPTWVTVRLNRLNHILTHTVTQLFQKKHLISEEIRCLLELLPRFELGTSSLFPSARFPVWVSVWGNENLLLNSSSASFSKRRLTGSSLCITLFTSLNLTGVYMDNLQNHIASQVELHFADHYHHFKEFQMSPAYRPYWDKCMEAVQNRELLSHIIFCNDLFHIPPVKTFLLYYEQDLISITGREDATLELFVKKAIGAFWGMVFKFVLGYQGQESVWS